MPEANATKPDGERIREIRNALIAAAQGEAQFASVLGKVLRRAYDEVIDTPRSGRFTISETEKTEKTYLGTKVEILFRHYLGLQRGTILDLAINGVEVDVKNTIGRNWTIPSEAVGHPCILIRSDESTAICSCGLLIMHRHFLNQGANKDGKRTVSQYGIAEIDWMLDQVSYPQNFWESVDSATLRRIMAPRGGSERLAQLFKAFPGRVISRDIVAAVAQQKDYMKRLRRNGGARDILGREKIVVLWGGNNSDADAIAMLGLPACSEEQFVSYAAADAADEQRLRSWGVL